MKESYIWILFILLFIVAFCSDLFVFERKVHAIPVKKALKLN